MGGKVWSDLEEEIYWSDIAPRAPPGLQGQSKAGRMKSWKPLVQRMEKMMRKTRPGQELPRKYTEVSLYEHGFQNLVQSKLSPNAKRHVEKYKALLEKKAENPESVSDNDEPESLEPSVHESEESEPSGPSEFAVAAPMSAISQQSATPQVTMTLEDTDMMIFPQHQEFISHGGPKINYPINRICGSQERPAKRARMMENNSHDTTLPACVVFPNHNNMPVQQNSTLVAHFPGSHPACRGYLDQNNMGAAYPGPVIGHYDAQNNANLFFDHNADPINCRGATGPGFVQNNTNLFMGHQPAQMNRGFVPGGVGVQKRKLAYM